MSIRRLLAVIAAAAPLVAGCKDDSPIPHTPVILEVVSGANQTGDLSTLLDSALVVRVLDGARRPVSGVALNWTVTGGGSLSATATTTDNQGASSVRWTLAPTPGSQLVMVTSAQVTGGSASFAASNGATITGTVLTTAVSPFAALSRAPGPAARRTGITAGLAPAAQARPRRFSPNRIIVGFRNDVLGVAGVTSSANRSMTVARQTSARLQQSLSTLSKRYPLGRSLVSPAMLAARIDVTDTTGLDATMARLREEPGVAWVERDEMISIRDGAPRPVSARVADGVTTGGALGGSVQAGVTLPSDPMLYQQLWPLNMVDLPRAWSITTGSPDVVVASLDMGIRYDHQAVGSNLTLDGYDFVSTMSLGSTESICTGGTFSTIEGDGDGPDPDPTDPDDLEFDDLFGCWRHSTLGDHGLWTAGIIGGVGNDAVGGAGVAWSVKIRPIRVLGINGIGWLFDIAQGVLYAAGLPVPGADSAMVQAPRAPIINMSLGGRSSSGALSNAVAAAVSAGSLIVASAGNDGLDLPTYPAAYPGVMAVSAVGMDGELATYSNAGTYISVAAPGGDFRLDDHGGGGVLGPGWDFTSDQPTYLYGYGTSAAAPFVSGVAALLLAHEPSLTASSLRARIEQFALRPAGTTRSDSYGWGVVDAYRSLTQSMGPARTSIVRLVNATTGIAERSAQVGSSGSFAFTRVGPGAYYLQAGEDEDADGRIGVPGRRFGWAGGFGAPTVLNISGNSQAVTIPLGMPAEVEPNDDAEHANLLVPDSYVIGTITPPDIRDLYRLSIGTAGMYTIETSGVVGSCGLGLEVDTYLSVDSQSGASIGTNDNVVQPTGHYCSRIQAQLAPGIYTVTVMGSTASRQSSRGRYRLAVRTGP